MASPGRARRPPAISGAMPSPVAPARFTYERLASLRLAVRHREPRQLATGRTTNASLQARRGLVAVLDLLVVGLGNSRRARSNRHNVGWMVVDELASRHGGGFQPSFPVSSRKFATANFDSPLKPELYMNLSGRPVRRCSVLQGHARAARRPRRGRLDSAACSARAAGSPATTGSARLRGSREPGLPPPAHRGRSARTWRPAAARRLRTVELRPARRRGGDRRPRGRCRRDHRPRGPRARAASPPLELTALP